MRDFALDVSETIVQTLQKIKTAQKPSDDITIKLLALLIVIANTLVQCSQKDKRHLAKSKRAVLSIFSEELENAWRDNYEKPHTEEDTRKMLRAIGILKN